MKMSRFIVACALLTVLAVVAAAPTTATCNWRVDGEECITQVPFCHTFEYTQEEMPEFYTYRCLKCHSGYQPTAPKGGIRKAQFTDLPSFEGEDYEYLQLCELAGNDEEVNCSNSLCHTMLPGCIRYKFSDKIEEDGIMEGRFTCLECKPQFDINEDPAERFGVVNYDLAKRVCKRREEERECGQNCQAEFPGCVYYKVSKVSATRADDHWVETAYFTCLSGYPGYHALNRALHSDTNPDIVKEIAVREYESPAIDCMDYQCKNVLPNCKKYFTLSSSEFRTAYTCLECKSGFKSTGSIYGEDFSALFLKQQFLHVCEAQESTGLECDEDCQLEVPGCQILSILEPKYISSDYQTARYICEKCGRGFIKVDDTTPVPVHMGWTSQNNIKIRCRPEEVKTPIECNEECQKRFPHCLKYTSIFEDMSAFDYEKFECHQCEAGYEPTTEPDIEPWYLMREESVCRRVINPVPFDCGGPCKVNFPNCDRLSISREQNGHNVYQCHQCESGYYPISYEDEVSGRLSIQDHYMRKFNKIYLCSNRNNEVFIDLTVCAETDLRRIEYKACQLTVNCKAVVTAKRFDSSDKYFKCLECHSGAVPKKSSPYPYDIDLSLCEDKPASLQSLKSAFSQ